MIWVNLTGLLFSLSGLGIVMFVRCMVGPSRFNTVAFYINIAGVLLNGTLLFLNLAALP